MKFWTDSTLVLQYIKNETHRFKVYVANRVTEIKNITNVNQWNHIEGEKNPADICSRGVKSLEDLATNKVKGKMWFYGPKFLWNDTESSQLTELAPLDCSNEEIKTKDYLVATVLENKFDFNKFGDWKKLCRIMSYVLRFLNNCRRANKVLNGMLATREVNKAEIKIIRTVQEAVFHKELNDVKKSIPLKESTLKQLNPFIDNDGMLKVGGRLKHAKIPYQSKHQIILPKDDHISLLIVRNIHNRSHMGTEYILSETRKV